MTPIFQQIHNPQFIPTNEMRSQLLVGDYLLQFVEQECSQNSHENTQIISQLKELIKICTKWTKLNYKTYLNNFFHKQV